jgi:hypothetical protein
VTKLAVKQTYIKAQVGISFGHPGLKVKVTDAKNRKMVSGQLLE